MAAWTRCQGARIGKDLVGIVARWSDRNVETYCKINKTVSFPNVQHQRHAEGQSPQRILVLQCHTCFFGINLTQPAYFLCRCGRFLK